VAHGKEPPETVFPLCRLVAMRTTIVFQGGNKVQVEESGTEVADRFREVLSTGSNFCELRVAGQDAVVMVNAANVDYIEVPREAQARDWNSVESP
jgi:hypothetical protein